MSAHELLWALRSYKYAMSALEFSLVLTVPRHHAQEWVWSIMIAYEHTLKSSYDRSLVLMSVNGTMLMSVDDC